MDSKLKGKHVLVTGASGGIGLVITRMLLDKGANVTASFYKSKIKMDDFPENSRERLNLSKADLRSEQEVKQLFETANGEFGRVDVLVTNAGIWFSEDTMIHEISLDQWNSTFVVNLTGVFLCCKYFFINLKQYPGNDASVIMIGSSTAIFGEAGHADYAASKSALIGLMLSLKNEIVHLSPRGRVNIINPGWTLTPMVEKALDDDVMLKKVLQTIPLRKIATPQDIATMTVFLASDALSGHISGQEITIAGGMEGRVLFTPDEIDIERYHN